MIKRLQFLLSALLLACTLPAMAAASTKMTIATGVDPGFSIFYVAKLGGFLEKNGIDVDLRTGPSGGAMVPLLISNASQASMSAAFAGISNHLKDPDIVAVAQMLRYDRWYGIVAKSDIKSLADLKTKKVGVSLGNASESYWYDALKHANLNAADFKPAMVNVEAPEMVAAIERGDIDAFAVWEPWPTRTVLSVKGTKILVGSKGLIRNRNFIYMNRGWIEKNKDTVIAFMKSLVEANDIINGEREKATAMVSKFLSMPAELTKELMPKLEFDMYWHDATLEAIDASVALLQKQGKFNGKFDYQAYIYADLLRTVRPDAVTLTKVKAG